MINTMTAFLTDGSGGVTRAELPLPVPAAAEIRVRVRAVALNNADIENSGVPEGTLAGYEFSGDVEAVGADVNEVLLGQRVMGTTPGAFAEHVIAHHRHVVVIPSELDYVEAAALPTALLTEHGALGIAGFAPGQSVLITAGTSSIGLVGIQVAKALGAGVVVATTRSDHKRDVLLTAGADAVVLTGDHAGPDSLGEATRAATGGRGVDVVLDHVAGDTFRDSLSAAADGGTVVNVGQLGGAQTSVDLGVMSSRHLTVRAVSFGFRDPETIGRLLDALGPIILPAVAQGLVRPVIASVRPFLETPEALRDVAGGSTIGKTVLHL